MKVRCRNIFKNILILFTIFCFLPPTFRIRAQFSAGLTPSSIQIIQNRLSEWFKKTAKTGEPHGTTLLLVFPGIGVDNNLQLDDESDYRSFVRILNTVPLPSGDRYKPSNQTVDVVYENILNYGAVEQIVSTEEEKEKLARAEKVLLKRYNWLTRFFDRIFRKKRAKKVSKKYNSYFRYARNFSLSQDAYQKALDNGQTSATELEILRNARRQAYCAWKVCGSKKEVEAALKDYDEVISRDPILKWSEIKDAYFASFIAIRNESRVLPTTVLPEYKDWDHADGWIKIDFDNSNASPDLIPDIEVKRIKIVRSWLNEDIFYRIKWHWSEHLPFGSDYKISDGLGTQNSSPRAQTAMPLLPTEFLLLRDPQTPENMQIGGIIAEILPALP